MRSRLIEGVRSRQDLAGDVLWSGGADLANILIRFASFLMLGHELGPTAYGAYLGMYGILNPVGGLSYAGLRLGVLQQALVGRRDLTNVAQSFLSLAVVQGAAAVLVATLIAGTVLDELSLGVLITFAVVELVLFAVADVVSSLLHAASSFVAGTKIRILSQVVRTGPLAGLYFTHSLSIAALGVALLATAGAFVAYLLFVRLPALVTPVRLTRPVRQDVVVAWQLSLTTFASSLSTDGDKAVLSANGMDREAGVYGAGYRVFQFAMLPMSSIQSAMFHRFLGAQWISGGQVRNAVRYTVPVVALGGLVGLVVFAAAPFLHLLLGDDFDESANVLRWLAPLLPVMAAAQGPANGLAGLDRLGLRSKIQGGVAALSMVLYIILVPRFGWRGAAAGTMIAELTTASALWLALIRAQASADAAGAPSEEAL